MRGSEIKKDNGSGYNLAGEFPKRKFHNSTIYIVHYNGIAPDCSNLVQIKRSRNGWC